MKNFFRVLTIISLVLIFIIIINIATYLSYPDDISYDNTLHFKTLSDNSLDIIIMGSSHAFNGINPDIIDQKLGTSSYVYATSGNTINYMTYQLNEVLKTQKPKVIVVELFSLFDLNEDEVNLHKAIDVYPISVNKIKAITHNAKDYDKADLYIPIKKYHATWTDKDYYNKIVKRLKLNDNINYNGYNYDEYTPFTSTNLLEVTPKEDINIVEADKIIALEQFMQKCAKENIQVVLVATPYESQKSVTSYDMKKAIESITPIANKYNVEIINYNDKYDELNITWQHLIDEGHLNASGAEIITNDLTQYLN